MKFNVLDKNGKNIECNVIGTFNNDNKHYIIYEENDNKEELYASLYELNENNNIILLPIIEESDWDLVDRYLENI